MIIAMTTPRLDHAVIPPSLPDCLQHGKSLAEAGSPRCTLQLIHALLGALQPAINFQNSPFKTKTMNLARTHSIIGYHDRLPDRAANLAEQIHRVLNHLSAQAPGNLKQEAATSVPTYAESNKQQTNPLRNHLRNVFDKRPASCQLRHRFFEFYFKYT